MSVRIITDSGSDILPGEHEDLVVLPLSIMFGTTTYADGADLSHERFYELLVEEDDLPKTGQVNPYAFSQAFEEAYEAGDEVVCITLSSKLSGTYQSALTAASEAKVVVRVVDSLNVCVGERALRKREDEQHGHAADGLTDCRRASRGQSVAAAAAELGAHDHAEAREYKKRRKRRRAPAADVLQPRRYVAPPAENARVAQQDSAEHDPWAGTSQELELTCEARVLDGGDVRHEPPDERE